ncbi:MAG: RNA polymerase-binding protein DksA [Arenimonas sp.]|nr:RNA polymerase-binding protein DksA [Arenimonas sp.]
MKKPVAKKSAVKKPVLKVSAKPVKKPVAKSVAAKSGATKKSSVKKVPVKATKKIPNKKVISPAKKLSVKKAANKSANKAIAAKPLPKKSIKTIVKKAVKAVTKKITKAPVKSNQKNQKPSAKPIAKKIAKKVEKKVEKKEDKKIAIKKVTVKTVEVKKKAPVEAIIHTASKAVKIPVKPLKPQVVTPTTVATKDPEPVVKSAESEKVITKQKAEKKPSKRMSSNPKFAEPPKPYVPSKPRDLPAGERAGFIKRELPSDAALKQKSVKRVTLPDGYKPNEKEEYMNDMQLEYFRQKLMAERETLLSATKETINDLKEEARDVGDEAERASRETENFFELRTRDRYRKLLYKIDKIIATIDDGTYGYCVDTGEEIGLRRLEGRPMAERTVDAQERWEHKKKQLGD